MADELIFKMRAVLDMTDPNEKVEAFRRSASESTFATPGTASRSPSASPAERQTRAIEAQTDRQQAGFMTTEGVVDTPEAKRSRVFDFSTRMSVNDWFYARRARIAGQSGVWQPGVDVAGHGNDFQFSSGGGGDLSAVSPSSPEHEARLQTMRRVNAPHAPGFGPLSRGYQYLAEDHWQMRNPEYGPGFGPNSAFNRQRAETQAEENEGVDAPHAPGFGPTAQGNETRAGEQAANATWARRNFPSIFGRGGNRGGMSVFYRRFLILESIRAVSQAINQVSQAGINTAATLGDPVAMAQSIITNTQAMAGAIPFAGAGVYGLANVASGGAANDVARAAASIQVANQAMAVNASLGVARHDLAQQGSVWAAPRGTLRESRNIQVGLEQTSADIRAREAQSAEVGATRAAQARSDARSGISGTVKSFIGAFGMFYSGQGASDEPFFQGEDASAASDAANSRRLSAQRRQHEEKIAQDRANRQQGELFTDAGLDIRASVTEGGTAAYQSSQTLMPNAGNFNSLRFGQSQRRQQREFKFQQFITRQENEMATERAKDPILAPFRMIGHMGERVLRRTQTNVENTQDELQTENQIGMGKQQYVTSMNVSNARLRRDPDAALLKQHSGNIDATQYLPPEMRQSAQNAAVADYEVKKQQLADSRTATADNLAIRETVTGMTAQAYGPGANLMRRRAGITAVAAGAESEAQGILRADSTAFGKSAADTARNIGINQIETQRAQYMEGLHMRSVSPTMIAAGNPAASRPDQVMRMMDEGTGMLQRNVGNYDITTGKSDSVGGTTNTLLMQILQVLSTGGGSRLGD